MRHPIVIAILMLACCCPADRLIHIPLGKKVPSHTVRLEGGVPLESTGSPFGYLDVGLNTFLDATIRTTDMPSVTRRATLDLGYNYISPIPDASPGISVGVQDLAGNTPDGRRFYIASTYRPSLGGSANVFTPAEVTIGALVGRRTSAFVGVMLPISPAFRLLAEHDGFRVNAGVEARPINRVWLKLLFIDTKPMLSAQVQQKF